MRECPAWFQSELTRIGGVNQYGKPVFRLAWSEGESTIIGGKWEKSGFIGYKRVRAYHGSPCWLLMVWEPCEVQGTYEQWMRDFRDEETGLLQCGGYPTHGRYRLMQAFIHREMIEQAKERLWMDGPHIRREIVSGSKMETYRMEPCGFMLDVMLPMLMSWRKLSDAAKTKALLQQEQQRKDEFASKVKDARAGHRISRSSQLVAKRAEIIEKGMRQAMAVAARYGLGMRVEA